MKSCLNGSGSFFCLQQVSFKKFYRIRILLPCKGYGEKWKMKKEVQIKNSFVAMEYTC